MNRLITRKGERLFTFIFSKKDLFRQLMSDIKEAISGSERDFTTTKLSKAIFILSVPMILEMVMESVFAIVDIFFVSKLGEDAIATVGITESLLTILYAFGAGISMATAAIISRRTGEKNTEGASITAVQAIILALSVSLVISFIGFFFASDILKLMGASETMIRDGSIFTQIMLTGNAAILLLFVINSIFRSAGDAALSMRVLWIANIINLILDPLLIYGVGPFPELGIMGAAIATTTGRTIAVCIQLYFLFNKKSRIRITKKQITFNFEIIKQLIKLSLGGVGQNIISTSSWIFLVRIVAVFGANVLAGYTIAIRILIFALLPSWGVSNAAATLVGQNLGANRPDRAERSVWITGIANTIFLSLIGFILVLFSENFIAFFIDKPDVIASGKNALRIISYGFLFYGFGMVIIQSFNGAGDTTTPIWLYVFCFWLFEIPLAYVLSNYSGFAENGVYISIICAETTMVIVGLLLFKSGKWKNKKV